MKKEEGRRKKEEGKIAYGQSTKGHCVSTNSKQFIEEGRRKKGKLLMESQRKATVCLQTPNNIKHPR
ncbi:MAG: hypothetical protein SWX82_01620 [Cyanobacteriota bacterium]|nr:hypothetical protein [Cyanobacteriota bacterium]